MIDSHSRTTDVVSLALTGTEKKRQRNGSVEERGYPVANLMNGRVAHFVEIRFEESSHAN